MLSFQLLVGVQNDALHAKEGIWRCITNFHMGLPLLIGLYLKDILAKVLKDKWAKPLTAALFVTEKDEHKNFVNKCFCQNKMNLNLTRSLDII